jgi:hypothetical protein
MRYELRALEDNYEEPRKGFLLGRFDDATEAAAAFGWLCVNNKGLMLFDGDGRLCWVDEFAQEALRVTVTGKRLTVLAGGKAVS